jgi:hypothetical protein
VKTPDRIVPSEYRLQLSAVVIRSPGFWECLGAISPLESIRKYLSERHERRKDREYKNRLEAQRLALENAKLRTEIVRDRIELLKELGVPARRIRQLLTVHIVQPLALLDRFQDSGLIENSYTVRKRRSVDTTLE